MGNPGTTATTVAITLKAISDDKSMALFRIIAEKTMSSSGGINTDGLRSLTKLTRKQYYSRLSRMLRRGLIKRKKGKYVLSSFGKVVYDAQVRVENALEYYWKLKAMDSLITSKELPSEDEQRVLDTLLGNNEELKKIFKKKV